MVELTIGWIGWVSPGAAGWRLKPARRGSGRPGWGGDKKAKPAQGWLNNVRGRGWSVGEAFPKIFFKNLLTRSAG